MPGKEGTPPRATPALLREAAVWFEVIHADEPSTDTLALWQRWMVAAEHRHAFRQVENLWRAAGKVTQPPWATIEELQADKYDGTQSVEEWSDRTERVPRERVWTLAAGFAAIAAGATLYLAMFRHEGLSQPPDMVQTGASEHRDLSLPDGTRLTLGARSSVRVEYTESVRGVTVERGQVFFDVASDASWPFVVRVGASTITAVGTAFSVERQSDRAIVTVTEGIVDVVEAAQPSGSGGDLLSPVAPVRRERLTAGQRLSLGAAGSPIETVDVQQALTWIDGRLTYLHEPLRYVIPDVGRYSNRTLVIADPAIEDLLYTGTVLQGQVDDWLASLSHSFPVEIVHAGDQTIVRLKELGAGPDTTVQ